MKMTNQWLFSQGVPTKGDDELAEKRHLRDACIFDFRSIGRPNSPAARTELVEILHIPAYFFPNLGL